MIRHRKTKEELHAYVSGEDRPVETTPMVEYLARYLIDNGWRPIKDPDASLSFWYHPDRPSIYEDEEGMTAIFLFHVAVDQQLQSELKEATGFPLLRVKDVPEWAFKQTSPVN